MKGVQEKTITSCPYLKNKSREWLSMNRRREVSNNLLLRAKRDLRKQIKKEIRYFSKNSSTSDKLLDLRIGSKKRVRHGRTDMRNSWSPSVSSTSQPWRR